MRYSLRTLLIVLSIVPLVVGVGVWMLWPEPGSPGTIRGFERALESGSSMRIEWATNRCFAVGVPVKRYQSLLAKADRVYPGDQIVDVPAKATVYEFSSGKSPEEGECCVLVAVDGHPPVIVSARVSVYTN